MVRLISVYFCVCVFCIGHKHGFLKNKAGLLETMPKGSDHAPKVSLKSKASNRPEFDLPSSPLQASKFYSDNSLRVSDLRPKFGEPKPLEHRLTKVQTPEKRLGKGTEWMALHEDLRKAREMLEKLEDEKLHALEELNEARRAAEEANEKLSAVISLQKKAEENCLIQKLRADELERESIESIDKIQSEIDLIKKQRTDDALALLSAMQERDKMKQELAMVTGTKNAALNHAEGAMKIAEDSAQKMKTMSMELAQTRKELDKALTCQLSMSEEQKASINAMWESKLQQSTKLVEKLDSEVKWAKTQLMDAESVTEKLWKRLTESNAKIELLEVEFERANSNERKANENVVSLLKQLEESNKFLKEAEAEIASLKESIESLERSLGEHRGNLAMSETIKALKMDLERMEELNTLSHKNEKTMALKIKSLEEEKMELSDDLRLVRDEEQRRLDEEALQKAKEYSAQLPQSSSLAESNSELFSVKQNLDYVTCENRGLKEVLGVKENELARISQEYEELRSREASALEKIAALSKLLAERRKADNADGSQLQTSIEEFQSQLSSGTEVSDRAMPDTLQFPGLMGEKENESAKSKREIIELRAREALALEEIKKLQQLLESRDLQKPDRNEELRREQKDASQQKAESSFEVPIKTFHEKSISLPTFSTLEYDQGEFQTDRNQAGVDAGSVHKQQQRKKNALFQIFGGLLKKRNTAK